MLCQTSTFISRIDRYNNDRRQCSHRRYMMVRMNTNDATTTMIKDVRVHGCDVREWDDLWILWLCAFVCIMYAKQCYCCLKLGIVGADIYWRFIASNNNFEWIWLLRWIFFDWIYSTTFDREWIVSICIEFFFLSSDPPYFRLRGQMNKNIELFSIVLLLNFGMLCDRGCHLFSMLRITQSVWNLLDSLGCRV